MDRSQWRNEVLTNIQRRLGGYRLERSVELYGAYVEVAELKEGNDPKRVTILAFETTPIGAGARAVAGQPFDFNIDNRTPKQAADEIVEWLASAVSGLQYGHHRALVEGPMTHNQAADRLKYYLQQKPIIRNAFCEMMFVEARLVQDDKGNWYCIAIGDPIGH